MDAKARLGFAPFMSACATIRATFNEMEVREGHGVLIQPLMQRFIDGKVPVDTGLQGLLSVALDEAVTSCAALNSKQQEKLRRRLGLNSNSESQPSAA